MANEDVVQEIEEEIKKAKGEPEDFEIEITDDPKEEAKDVAEEKQEAKEETEQEDEYGPKVQKRIKKLVDQRREAEIQDSSKVQLKTTKMLLINATSKQKKH